MKPLLLILATGIGATGIGVAAIVLGEADDSPSLQRLGVLLVIDTVALGVRSAKEYVSSTADVVRVNADA